MFDNLLVFLSKPITGLVILVHLFAGDRPESNGPSIAKLTFAQSADSVFIQASLQNALTPKVNELLTGGVAVQTLCTFTCGTFSTTWARRTQYNPVQRTGCDFARDGTCRKVFKEESIASHFNTVVFYVADTTAVSDLENIEATLKICSTTQIDAMGIGEKELWPNKITAHFIVPRLSRMK